MEKLSIMPENSEQFWGVFNSCCQITREGVSSAEADEKIDRIPSLKLNIFELQVFATNATPMLPQYDVKRSQQEIESLTNSLNTLEAKLRPRKKFSFSTKNKLEAPIQKSSSLGAVQECAAQSSLSGQRLGDASKVIEGETNCNLVLDQDSFPISEIPPQILIRNCSGVSLVAPIIIGSARLENVRNSVLVLGPCCTSIYLEGCSETILFTSCHQLRIHTCRSCSLYVKVKTHPIIEDCLDMGFAPYNISYPLFSTHILVAGLQDAACWDNVVDFRWHKSTPSPCWHILEPSSRATESSIRHSFPLISAVLISMSLHIVSDCQHIESGILADTTNSVDSPSDVGTESSTNAVLTEFEDDDEI